MSRQRPTSGCRTVGTCAVVAIWCCSRRASRRAAAAPSPITATPGAAGAGDPYFPLDGNGGYDTEHYLLDLSYVPATDMLAGSATIRARATQHLSRFNLDLEGLTVHSIEVNGRAAAWTREGGELVITPARRHPQSRALHHQDRLQRRTRDDRRPLRHQRLHPHGRRAARHRPAARRRHVVSRQRPSERQGRLHVPDHGSRGSRGGRQRCAARPSTRAAPGRRGRGTPESRWRPT